MATRIELNVLVRRRLGDLTPTYTLTDDQVNQWINDGIASYSSYFPKTKMYYVITTPGTKEYALPADYRAMIRVEYPIGADPEEMLGRVDSGNRELESGEYDVRSMITSEYLAGGTIPTVSGEGHSILLGDDPTGNVLISYQGDHTYLEDGTAETTVPDRHLEAIVLFCRWAAFQELATNEAFNPEPTGLLAGTLELDAGRAERQYRKVISEFGKNESDSRQLTWKMDSNDRIY